MFIHSELARIENNVEALQILQCWSCLILRVGSVFVKFSFIFLMTRLFNRLLVGIFFFCNRIFFFIYIARYVDCNTLISY